MAISAACPGSYRHAHAHGSDPGDPKISRGKVPACVEACPTQARIFGEIKKKASPLVRFLRLNKISVLKPYLNTEPKVFYANLDMEVK